MLVPIAVERGIRIRFRSRGYLGVGVGVGVTEVTGFWLARMSIFG